jgi:hypothetical protein
MRTCVHEFILYHCVPLLLLLLVLVIQLCVRALQNHTQQRKGVLNMCTPGNACRQQPLQLTSVHRVVAVMIQLQQTPLTTSCVFVYERVRRALACILRI